MGEVNLSLRRQQQFDQTLTTRENLAAMMQLGYKNAEMAYVQAQGDKFALFRLLNDYTGTLTRGSSATDYELLGDDEIRYFVKESTNRLVRILEPPSNDGANGNPFTVLFENNFFHEGYVLSWPSGVQSRVYQEPVQVNGGWLYTLQHLKSNVRLSPTTDFTPGKSCSYYYNLHPEMSKNGHSYAFLHNMWTQHFSIMRVSAEMSGSADAITIMSAPPDSKGKVARVWWDYKQQELMDQYYMNQEMLFVEGQSTINFDGVSTLKANNGFEVRAGHGLREYCTYGQTFSYFPGTTSYQYWQQVLETLILNSLSEGQKDFMFICGFELYREFNQAISDYVVTQRLSTNSEFIKPYKKGYNLDYNFTKITGLFGCSITMVPYWPWSNPKLFGHQQHPFTGKPLKSYEGMMIDTSLLKNGRRNFSIYAKGDKQRDRSNITWVVPGSSGPRGFDTKGIGASGLDGWEMHMLCEKAVVLWYPYSSALITPVY